mmetsp:Transcript_11627/g.18629  ORF Transcript_11627/g.18629 Transcript_11627/m.18629 type:complete len:219 (+) Transcript_11627:1310-1966(+)
MKQDRILGLPVPIFASSRRIIREGRLRVLIPPSTTGVELPLGMKSSNKKRLIEAAKTGYAVDCNVYLFSDLLMWTDENNHWRGSGKLQDAKVEEIKTGSAEAREVGYVAFSVTFSSLWHRPPSKNEIVRHHASLGSKWSPFQSHRKRSKATRNLRSRSSPNGAGIGGSVAGADAVAVRFAVLYGDENAEEWITAIRGIVFDLEVIMSARKRLTEANAE